MSYYDLSQTLSCRLRNATLHPSLAVLRDRVFASAIAMRFVRGAFWSVLGTAIARGLGVVASVWMARVLGAHAFGELGMVQSTVGMFGVVAGLGLGTTATKYVAECRTADPARAGRIVALSSAVSWLTSGAMALVLYLAAPWFANHTLSAPEMQTPLEIGSLLLLFGGINGAQVGALSGLEAFRTIANISAWVGILNFPLLAIGVSVAGVNGAVWGLVANVAANCVLNYYHLRQELRRCNIRITWNGLRAECDVLWKFSAPITLSSLIIVPANWLTSTMLATSAYGYTAVGVFSASQQWRNFVMLVPSLLGGVVIPMLSSLRGERNRGGYRKLLVVNLLIVTVGAGIVCVAIAVCSDMIARSYGPAFEGSRTTFTLMALSGLLVAVNSVVANAIITLGRAWTGLLFCILSASLLLVAASKLIPIQGAGGLALANVIAYSAHTLWQGGYLRRVLRQVDQG